MLNKDLVFVQFFNFIITIVKALTYAVGCYLAWRAFDILDKVDIRKEITENKNIGWALMVAAIFGGLAYVIGQM